VGRGKESCHEEEKRGRDMELGGKWFQDLKRKQVEAPESRGGPVYSSVLQGFHSGSGVRPANSPPCNPRKRTLVQEQLGRDPAQTIRILGTEKW